MRRNRIIYTIILILAIVYASYYGGHLPYTLLYTVMFVPVISIIYTLIVYNKFRIYQEIPVRQVTKNQAVSYDLTIENDFIFSFTRIDLDFFEDVATIKDSHLFSHHTMLPKTQNKYTSTIVPRYRGTYYMGVEYLEVTDIFYLMKIKYKIPTMPRITVSPRIININKLKVGIDSVDSRNPNNNMNNNDFEMDNEVRSYVPGDSARRIHWKQVARKRELVTRKIISNEVFQSMIIMDLTPVLCEEKRLIIEDKIIEAALAIANNYVCNNTSISVASNSNYTSSKASNGVISNSYNSKNASNGISGKNKVFNNIINDAQQFKLYLKYCSDIKFNNDTSYVDTIKRIRLVDAVSKNYIIITNKLDSKANQYFAELSLLGNKINIVYVASDDIKVISELDGVNIVNVLINQEIEDALSE